MNKIKTICFLLPFVFLFSGCTGIIYSMIGAHEAKKLDENTILKYSRENNIPANANYILDSSYFSFIATFDTAYYALQRKNHTQPLQALYYDRSGMLKVFVINCYAGGLLNLKWNRGGILDTFLPRKQAPVDSILPKSVLLKHLRALPGTSAPSPEPVDYTVVIFWNHFLERQSRRLIEAIQKNISLAKGKRVNVIYVNNDNLFAGKF